MPLRSLRERALMTVLMEAGAIVVVAPLYQRAFGASASGSLLLLSAVSAAVMLFSPVYGLAFDLAEWRLCRRVASDRPQALRFVHAAGHELGAMCASVPVILALTDHSLAVAIGLDIGLSLFYTVWVWAFCLGYDRARPVRD